MILVIEQEVVTDLCSWSWLTFLRYEVTNSSYAFSPLAVPLASVSAEIKTSCSYHTNKLEIICEAICNTSSIRGDPQRETKVFVIRPYFK